MSATVKPSSPLSIGLAWLVVIVPATWGVYYTVLGAANLFK
jgi:hypothetical protein